VEVEVLVLQEQRLHHQEAHHHQDKLVQEEQEEQHLLQVHQSLMQVVAVEVFNLDILLELVVLEEGVLVKQALVLELQELQTLAVEEVEVELHVAQVETVDQAW
jgi:hypothetical protein